MSIEEAVERLNAIKQFIGYDKDSEIVKATQKSLDMAIKALEQGDVLREIRQEIANLVKTYPFTDHMDTYVKEDEVFEIIDSKIKELSE